MIRGNVNLVVALAAEARPLIDHFRLVPDGGDGREGPLTFYRRDSLRLVVCGLGKVAAATGVGALGARESRAAWLNVGLAGHRDLEMGSLRRAHKIVDADDGRVGYPPTILNAGCPGCEVRTVSQPEREFPTDALYDMEAAPFFFAANRYAPAEVVQVLKVVSDNQSNPAERPSRETVHRLLAEHLGTFERAMGELADLAAEIAPRSDPGELDGFLSTWRFSVTEERRLRDLLRRLECLDPARRVFDDVSSLSRTRKVLEHLEARVLRTPAVPGRAETP